MESKETYARKVEFNNIYKIMKITGGLCICFHPNEHSGYCQTQAPRSFLNINNRLIKSKRDNGYCQSWVYSVIMLISYKSLKYTFERYLIDDKSIWAIQRSIDFDKVCERHFSRFLQQSKYIFTRNANTFTWASNKLWSCGYVSAAVTK